ncbi:hypothetical protein PT2222_60088 [Paraburkholderia tropica]
MGAVRPTLDVGTLATGCGQARAAGEDGTGDAKRLNGGAWLLRSADRLRATYRHSSSTKTAPPIRTTRNAFAPRAAPGERQGYRHPTRALAPNHDPAAV